MVGWLLECKPYPKSQSLWLGKFAIPTLYCKCFWHWVNPTLHSFCLGVPFFVWVYQGYEPVTIRASGLSLYWGWVKANFLSKLNIKIAGLKVDESHHPKFFTPPVYGLNYGQIHGSLNVPIEHHPTIRYMVYNGYYKVMSNIPKMGHLPTPEIPY